MALVDLVVDTGRSTEIGNNPEIKDSRAITSRLAVGRRLASNLLCNIIYGLQSHQGASDTAAVEPNSCDVSAGLNITKRAEPEGFCMGLPGVLLRHSTRRFREHCRVAGHHIMISCSGTTMPASSNPTR